MEGGSPEKCVSSSFADPAIVGRWRLPIGVRTCARALESLRKTTLNVNDFCRANNTLAWG